MTQTLIFGSPKPNVHYAERRAAYLVVIRDRLVAMVKGREKYFLPGGGSEACERPEETVVREVREELARAVGGLRFLGEAVQYFYASMDDRHYKMMATFFAGEFTEETFETGCEHALVWLPVAEVGRDCFHECHAWAIHHYATLL